MIIHFHGLASEGQGSKYKMLKNCFPHQHIGSPDIPVDPSELKQRICGEIEDYLDSLNIYFGLHSGLSEELAQIEKLVSGGLIDFGI